MSSADAGTTIVECSGVGPGGLSRLLSQLVRYWPAEQRLDLIAVPPVWDPPTGRSADTIVHSRQSSSRGRTIAAAAAALRRATARRAAPPPRVLSLSPSAAMLGSRLPVTTLMHDVAFRLWPRAVRPPARLYRRASYALAVARSAQLICVSARTRHDLLGLYGEAAARSRIWHPGGDLDVAPGQLPAPLAQVRQRGQRFLVVDGHAEHKGAELAIEAIGHDPRFVLAVLTAGQRVPRFEQAAAASPAASRILFLDRLSDSDYVAVLMGAAAFLMPSHIEGYGLPAVEALRLGTPTIISPDPALSEAAGAGAIRMAAWSGAALAQALDAIGSQRIQPAQVGRTWQEAIGQLAELVAGQPAATSAGGAGPSSTTGPA